jgi:hypothetical protein
MPNASEPVRQELQHSPRQAPPDDPHPFGPPRVLSPLDIARAARAGWRRRRVSVRANVLRVRNYRYRNPWPDSRFQPCHVAAAAVPSILPRRAGSGTNQHKANAAGSQTKGTNRNHRGSSAARAFTIERAECPTISRSKPYLEIPGRRATP